MRRCRRRRGREAEERKNLRWSEFAREFRRMWKKEEEKEKEKEKEKAQTDRKSLHGVIEFNLDSSPALRNCNAGKSECVGLEAVAESRSYLNYSSCFTNLEKHNKTNLGLSCKKLEKPRGSLVRKVFWTKESLRYAAPRSTGSASTSLSSRDYNLGPRGALWQGGSRTGGTAGVGGGPEPVRPGGGRTLGSTDPSELSENNSTNNNSVTDIPVGFSPGPGTQRPPFRQRGAGVPEPFFRTVPAANGPYDLFKSENRRCNSYGRSLLARSMRRKRQHEARAVRRRLYRLYHPLASGAAPVARHAAVDARQALEAKLDNIGRPSTPPESRGPRLRFYLSEAGHMASYRGVDNVYFTDRARKFDMDLNNKEIPRSLYEQRGVIPKSKVKIEEHAGTKSSTKVWTSNIETLKQSGMIELVIAILEKHGVDMCFLQETSIDEVRDINCANDWRLINIVEKDVDVATGTAVLLSPSIQPSYMGYPLVSGRHLIVMTRTIDGPMIFEGVHGPQDYATKKRKDKFYKDLSRADGEGAAAWSRIIIGDLNVM